MAVGSAAGGGRRSILLALAVSLAAPLLGYAAVRNAAIDMAGNVADPSTVLRPRYLMPELKARLRMAQKPGQRLPDDTIAFARRAAARLPMAYEPYYLAGRAEEQNGRYRRATVLMEEARRRRPNSTSVRVALLGYYGLAEAYQQAIDEADMAMRIDDDSMEIILPGFAKLVAVDPKARKAIAVALARSPPWRQGFLEAAVSAKMSPSIAKSLVADIRRLAPSRSAGPEEAFLVRALVEAGDYRGARVLWESYRSPAERSANAVVDSGFTGAAGMKPFTWSFTSGENGTAELAKGEGRVESLLEVDYFGDADTVLAEQTLAAAPGSYRLSAKAAGTSSGPDVRLSWTLSCLPSGAPVGTLELLPLRESMAHRETAVSIPGASCAGQKLVLLGQPGEVPRTVTAQISEVSLVAAPKGRAK